MSKLSKILNKFDQYLGQENAVMSDDDAFDALVNATLLNQSKNK